LAGGVLHRGLQVEVHADVCGQRVQQFLQPEGPSVASFLAGDVGIEDPVRLCRVVGDDEDVIGRPTHIYLEPLDAQFDRHQERLEGVLAAPVYDSATAATVADDHWFARPEHKVAIHDTPSQCRPNAS